MRVSFYIIGERSRFVANDSANNGVTGVYQLVAELCEKALSRQAGQKKPNQLRIMAPDLAVKTIDDALWCYSSTSFLPHSVCVGASAPSIHGVGICTALTAGFSGVVFNLVDEPLLALISGRIIEVVAPNHAAKHLGRQRYKAYQSQGYALESFHV